MGSGCNPCKKIRKNSDDDDIEKPFNKSQRSLRPPIGKLITGQSTRFLKEAGKVGTLQKSLFAKPNNLDEKKEEDHENANKLKTRLPTCGSKKLSALTPAYGIPLKTAQEKNGNTEKKCILSVFNIKLAADICKNVSKQITHIIPDEKEPVNPRRKSSLSSELELDESRHCELQKGENNSKTLISTDVSNDNISKCKGVNDFSRFTSTIGANSITMEEDNKSRDLNKTSKDPNEQIIPELPTSQTLTKKNCPIEPPEKNEKKEEEKEKPKISRLVTGEHYKPVICKNVLSKRSTMMGLKQNYEKAQIQNKHPPKLASKEENNQGDTPTVAQHIRIDMNSLNKSTESFADKSCESPKNCMPGFLKRKETTQMDVSLSEFFWSTNLRDRRKSADISCGLDASTVIENTSAIARKDEDGNKYINQYMLLDKLGRYAIFVKCNVEGIMEQ